MKHWKLTADGKVVEERIDDQAHIPSIEEIEEKITGGGGGFIDELGEDRDRPVPPAQGPEVEIDDHYANLPDTPRGEGFFP